MSSTATAPSFARFSNELDASELSASWGDVRRGSAEARERLILHYVPLVSLAARRLAGAFSPVCDRQDMVAAGVIGLIEAIERFDPARGVLFQTFALHRIRGAMLDQLRDLDWLSQTMRAKSRELDRAVTKLTVELKREPGEEELASEIGCNVRDLRERVDAAMKTRMLAVENLSDAATRAATPVGGSDACGDGGCQEPVRLIERQEMRSALKDAIEELDDRERKVIVLGYLEDLTLARVGEIIGVCPSRVWQIQSRIVERLRRRLADYAD